MNKVLNILKKAGIYLGIFLLIIFLLALLSYFTNISMKVINSFIFILMLTTLFITGLKVGKAKENKGLLRGLLASFIIVFIFYIISGFIDTFKIDMSKLIYYLTLILACTLGSVIGVNKKKN